MPEETQSIYCNAERHGRVEGGLHAVHRDVNDLVAQLQYARIDAGYLVADNQYSGRSCYVGRDAGKGNGVCAAFKGPQSHTAVPEVFSCSEPVSMVDPGDIVLCTQGCLCQAPVCRCRRQSAQVNPAYPGPVCSPEKSTDVIDASDIVQENFYCRIWGALRYVLDAVFLIRALHRDCRCPAQWAYPSKIILLEDRKTHGAFRSAALFYYMERVFPHAFCDITAVIAGQIV